MESNGLLAVSVSWKPDWMRSEPGIPGMLNGVPSCLLSEHVGFIVMLLCLSSSTLFSFSLLCCFSKQRVAAPGFQIAILHPSVTLGRPDQCGRASNPLNKHVCSPLDITHCLYCLSKSPPDPLTFEHGSNKARL